MQTSVGYIGGDAFLRKGAGGRGSARTGGGGGSRGGTSGGGSGGDRANRDGAGDGPGGICDSCWWQWTCCEAEDEEWPGCRSGTHAPDSNIHMAQTRVSMKGEGFA